MEPNKKEIKEQTLSTQARFAELNSTIRQAIDAGQVGFGDLCACMGVAPAYLRAILNGNRIWSGVKADALRALAKALNKPPLWVMVRAGRIQVEDFFSRPAAQFVADSYEELIAHPEVSGFIPDRATWEATPEATRTAFVLLFHAGVNAQRQAA